MLQVANFGSFNLSQQYSTNFKAEKIKIRQLLPPEINIFSPEVPLNELRRTLTY